MHTNKKGTAMCVHLYVPSPLRTSIRSLTFTLPHDLSLC